MTLKSHKVSIIGWCMYD